VWCLWSVLRCVEICLNLCEADIYGNVMELCLIDGLYLMITQLCSVEHCVTLGFCHPSVLTVVCFAYGERLLSIGRVVFLWFWYWSQL